MEVGSERERLQSSKRETSPERVKICSGRRRKVQIVYYLSRNGVLEHPHFMEVRLEAWQVPLRLKHVFDRLMALRGSGMPLQYSWSIKRKYKSGYVWHDLAPKDILYPSHSYSHGLEEYVLKGSHLLQPSTPAEIIHGDKTRSSYTTTSTPHYSRCEVLPHVNTSKVSAVPGGCNNNSATLADKLNQGEGGNGRKNNERRVLLEDEGSRTAPSRHSLLLQLIACGTSALEMKGRQHEASLSSVGTTKKRESMGKKLQCETEDKDYFSGSLLEVAQAPSPLEAELTRSNSYDEQRGRRSRLGMEESEEEEGGGGVIHKCIPRKKSSSN